jgi:hypothetical protein
MKFQQRDVVYVKKPLPSPANDADEDEEHPFLILSCRSANSIESYYTAVMITSMKKVDVFTFKVNDSMFESPLPKKDCQLRLYIIVSFRESEARRFLTRMKKVDFTAVMAQIKNYVLAIDS